MKETFYFSHDYNARNDGKLVKVMMKHGLVGIGAYWCIVEMLYEEGGYISIDEYERIAFELRTSENVIQEVINDYGLFTISDNTFHSNSVIDRLNQRMDKSEKARISVQKRWKKREEENTNVLRTQNDSNTIKERKGKEIKEKESKTEIVALQPNEYQESILYLKRQTLENIDIPEFAEDYKNDWIAFIAYWTEKGRTGKLRAEGEKTFEIRRRWATWMSRKVEKYQSQQPKQKPVNDDPLLRF